MVRMMPEYKLYFAEIICIELLAAIPCYFINNISISFFSDYVVYIDMVESMRNI